jgi:suppressor for copper-sensitivity B
MILTYNEWRPISVSYSHKAVMFRDPCRPYRKLNYRQSIMARMFRLANLSQQTGRVFSASVAAVLAGLCVLGSAAPALAGSASAWAANDHARVRLISAVDATGSAETLRLGVEFRLAPQWKIYWRAPGDAGYPPTIDWTGSVNLAQAELAWPVPRRYSIFGLNTYVYQDSVVLPLSVKPQQAGAPLALRAHVNYLLCDQICIPYEADLDFALPGGEAKPTELAADIDRFQAQVPRKVSGPGDASGIAVERAALTPQSATLPGPGADRGTLEVLARSATPFTAPDLLVEGPNQLSFGVPQVDLSDGGRLALLRVPVGVASKAAMPQDPTLTLTLFDGSRAIEQNVTAVTGVGSAAAQTATLLRILTLALLGGFILNIMPCVLPVLSIKLMSAVAQSGRSVRHVRASFLATAGGIVASILVLGGVVATFKVAGMAVGWGVQFQQPVFLAAMALVVTLFAANLWGLFSIGLPRAVGDAAGRTHDGQSLSGDFATGVFATLLATPCSAPFLGTAIGFALTRGAGEILAVFAALGIGLALPYLAVAAAPALARLLPRPGAWMIVLRTILGIVLASTAAWLIMVLSVQVGWAVASGIAAILVALVLVLAVSRYFAPMRGMRAATLATVLVLAGAALVLSRYAALAPRDEARSASTAWRPFDRVAIFNAVAEGKVVLVDVTADWCITCQANKALVLDRGAVRQRIESGEVLALRADWTRPDKAIAAYLASFGRYGIPFNAVYGPGAPAGVPLPELLRSEDVLAAMDRAAKPSPDPTAGH